MSEAIKKTFLISDFSAKQYAYLQYASDNEIKKIQTQLFLQHINYTLSKSEFYCNLYSEKGIDINKIRKISDINFLPLTNKDDLLIPEKFLCADKKEIVDICLTSATSGTKPSIISLTEQDLSRLAYNEEAALDMTGINKGDTILVCAALDKCFMAGIAYFLGAVKLKASVVRGGSSSASQLWELVKITNATAIVGVPSL